MEKSKQTNPEIDDWEDVIETPEATSSEVDDWQDEFSVPEEDEDTGTQSNIESALLGLGEGVSLGLDEILAGAGGAAIRGAEKVGEALGIGTDAELKEQGFKLPEEDLLDAYYSAKETSRGMKETAREEDPAAYYSGLLAGSIGGGGASAAAAKGLSAGGKVAKTVSKLLPGQGKLWQEGAKAGTLSGLGQGDAKLLEGDVAGTAKDVLVGAGIGATTGGLMKGGQVLAGKLKNLPGPKSVVQGFKAGEKGIDISDNDVINRYVTDKTKEVRKLLGDKLTGTSKKEVLEAADAIGTRVNLGEPIDEVIEQIKVEGAFNKKEQKQLMDFVNELKAKSKDYNQELIKAQEKVQTNLDKAAVKNLAKGGTNIGGTQAKIPASTARPQTKMDQDMLVGTDVLVDAEGKPIIKQAVSQIKEPEVPIKQYDLQQARLTEAEELRKKLGQIGFDGKDDAASAPARDLYNKIRDKIDEAIESSNLPEERKMTADLINALDAIGLNPQDVTTQNRQKAQKAVQKLRNKLTSEGFDTFDFLEGIREFNPKLAKELSEETELLTNLRSFKTSSEGEGSTSLRAITGPVQRGLEVTGNIGGLFSKGAKEKISRAANKTYIPQLAEKAASTDKYKAFVKPLEEISNMSDSQRKVMMYGLMQQPAFREFVNSTEKLTGLEDEDEQGN